MRMRAVLLLAFAANVAAPAVAGPAPDALETSLARSLENNVPDGFTVATVGDIIQSYPIAQLQDARLQTALGWLKGADMTFGNLENTLVDIRRFNGYPGLVSGTIRIAAVADTAKDLKAMGFGLVSRANNHTTDWGHEGMNETDRLLDAAGIAHAGSGKDRAAAGAPAYFAAPKGRVALVSIAASYEDGAPALAAAGEAPGRPGANILRTTRKIFLDHATMLEWRHLQQTVPRGIGGGSLLSVPGTVFLEGEPGMTYEMNPDDVRDLLHAVRQGKLTSDFLMVNVHAHEPGNWSEAPANFLPDLARQAIDAGADMIVCEGPHILRGIEVYKGKPIFYSLGNFVFSMASTAAPVASDMAALTAENPDIKTAAEINEAHVGINLADPAWYESVVALTVFRGHKLAEIRLHPIQLDMGRIAARGMPRAASGAAATNILERLAKLSAPFGTKIEIKDGVGVIH